MKHWAATFENSVSIVITVGNYSNTIIITVCIMDS